MDPNQPINTPQPQDVNNGVGNPQPTINPEPQVVNTAMPSAQPSNPPLPEAVPQPQPVQTPQYAQPQPNYGPVTPQAMPPQNSQPKTGSKALLIIIGLVVLVVLAVLIFVFINHSTTKKAGGSTLKSVTSNSTPAIAGVTVSSSVSSSYKQASSALTSEEQQDGVLGELSYTNTDSSINTNSVIYVWGTISSSNASSSSSSELKQAENAASSIGATTQKVSAPNISVKGSNNKTYTLSCAGATTSTPAQDGVAAITISGDTCFGKFDGGKQYLSMVVSDSQDQDSQALAAQFASGTTVNF